jgi:IS5 family transposase
MKRLVRTKKLFAFLRLHRHELFDEPFQEELEGMYRQTGAGTEPLPPAILCMIVLLQAYTGISDAEAVELTIMDARWQLVLDCMNAERPLVSQGALQKFRERLVASGLDRRLLERTVELAKDSQEFDWKKLPKELRVAVDSRPLAGAGRVEDTINLLGHAARKIVALASTLTDLPIDTIAEQARIPIALYGSTKAALDRDWSDPAQREKALDELMTQIASLQVWLERKKLHEERPLQRYIAALGQIRAQDTEQGPDGHVRIKQGVAEDRRISIEDPEMRHGRKSKSKRFNGYKQHIATDLDTRLILACAVTPANRPEEEATPQLAEDLSAQSVRIGRLFVDRGYINSDLVEETQSAGGEVVCKPWFVRGSRPGLFKKTDFKLNMRDSTITCPAGHMESFEPGQVVEFDPELCGPCPLRSQCTHSASGKGRTISIAEDERLQKKLRTLQSTQRGRAQLRERVGVEHRLAHIAARQGPRARYIGLDKNLFDLRRVAAIQNLETVQRRKSAA